MARHIRNIEPTWRRPKRRGFTLAEALIACTVLGAAVIGIVSPLIASQQQIETLQQADLSVGLAQELMEEITSLPYVDPSTGQATLGPVAGRTSRSSFVAVGDFNGYSDQTKSLTTAAGASVTLPTAGSYTRKVHVEYRMNPSGVSVSSGDFALVQVTVTRPDGQSYVLSRIVCKFPFSS